MIIYDADMPCKSFSYSFWNYVLCQLAACVHFIDWSYLPVNSLSGRGPAALNIAIHEAVANTGVGAHEVALGVNLG